MDAKLSTINIKPSAAHSHSIIWLHGLGADGHDFEGIVPSLRLDDAANIHFVFPNAPVQAVTINGGAKMRAWYDILEMSMERQVDVSGIYQSVAAIEQLISEEITKGIPSENILLAGFSQGGVIALLAGLKYPQKLAGIVALSTYLPMLEQLKVERSPANNSTPIFMGHGILDSVVDVEIGKKAADGLIALGYDVSWHDYVIEHSVCVEEVEHIANFINTLFYRP
ncbi:alpha/beta hydrolase [Crenothrix polyspora]|uniref:Carboxylesterase n=1 Tax=Crenothrix polyspora TaxID=360316 RepID=A0A1R4HBQ9_9GAMM|nr:alpha/beta fold hydrolase [Crenothrix polyspora]SJM93310.1 Carboxylesterase [Crenothrix polyspora]